MNITCAKDVSKTGHNSVCMIEVQINLTAYSPDDTKFNDIEHKISILICIDSRDIAISNSATDGQPDKYVNRINGNYKNKSVIVICVAFIVIVGVIIYSYYSIVTDRVNNPNMIDDNLNDLGNTEAAEPPDINWFFNH